MTCTEQLDELRATLHKPAVTELIKPYEAGRLVNEFKTLTEVVVDLPCVSRSDDPSDDFLLALCEEGRADYLVTGDKSGLLTVAPHHATRIVSARDFAALLPGRHRRRRAP